MSREMRTDFEEDQLPIASLCEALDRDRSHALVLAVSPTASSARIPALLSRRLSESHELLIYSLAGLDPDAAVARVVGGDASSQGDGSDARLLRRVEELCERGSAMILVLPDAASISAATLHRLGRLASASRRGLRLALLVDCSAAEVDSTTATLVGDLGVGVEKLVVGQPIGQSPVAGSSRARIRSSELRRLALSGPPRVEQEEERSRLHEKGIRVRGLGQTRRGHAAGWAVLGFLAALQIAWWSGPSLDPVKAPSLDRVTVPSLDPVAAPPLDRVTAPSLDPVAAPPLDHVMSGTPPRGASPAVSAAPAFAVAQAGRVRPEQVLAGELQQRENDTPASTALPALVPEAEPRERQSSEPAPVAAASPETRSAPPTAVSAPLPKAASPPPERPRPTIPVNFNARPWARVELDGRELGTTPLANVPVEVGTHRIVLHYPDGRVIEEQVEVDRYRRYLRFE